MMTQNVHSLRSKNQAINLDAIIDLMISKKLDTYCIQETWLDKNFIKDINGYTMFHHGLTSQKCSIVYCRQ